MNAPAMRMFVPVLRQVEHGLALPVPDRVRILRELEYDLEELYGRFIQEGIEPTEARDRALEALVPDSGTLSKLDRLHARWYRRVTEHLTASSLRAYERAGLLLCAISVAIIQTVALFRVELLRDPSPFLFPVIELGALLFASVAKRAFGLWTRGDHSLPDPGLQVILGLSAAILLTRSGGIRVRTSYSSRRGLKRPPSWSKSWLQAGSFGTPLFSPFPCCWPSQGA